jgi:type I restriction enzyme S subunit
LDLREVLRIDPEIAAKHKRSRLAGGEVLITLVGSVGQVAVVPAALDGWNVARAVGVIPVRRDVSSQWVAWCLRTPEAIRYLDARLNTTVQRTMNLRDLASLRIPLPPIGAIRIISSVLGVLDDKIDSNQRLATLLEEVAETLFRARFVDFVGVENLKDSEIGQIPANWRSGIIRDLAVLRYGKALRAAERVAGLVAVVGSSGVIGTHTRHLVEGPAVVIGRKGTVGSVIWVGCNAWPIDTTFVAEPIEGVHPIFLYFMLRQADLPHLTADTGVPGLNRDAAERHAVLVPSRDAVSDFASVAEPWFKQRDHLHKEVATLTAIRDALLPKLISSEIRVPDTNDPEEVIGPAAEELAAATP